MHTIAGADSVWASSKNNIYRIPLATSSDPDSCSSPLLAEGAGYSLGAVQVDGRLVDLANIRMAQNLLQKADAIPGK